MGYFLAVTAFHTGDVDAVSKSVIEYAQEYKVPASVVDKATQPNEKRNGLVFKSGKDWVIVLWPEYFNIHDAPLAQWVSKNKDMLVSTIGVYDGDYWCHGMYKSGEKIDSFCSIPTYWSNSKEQAKSDSERLKGNPKRVAKEFSIEPAKIEGYYTHLELGKDYSKVHQDDEFKVNNFWVFTDFWDELGINYPEDVSGFEIMLDLTDKYGENLPPGGV